MNRKNYQSIPLIVLFLAISFIATAQDSASDQGIKRKNSNHPGMNILKVNLTAIALKNYSFQAERVLSKSISVAFSYRTMPSTTLPFQHSILKIVGDDPETKKTIQDFKLSNMAITPEIRFYLSKKGYGRGFYIAPFYRYASFKTNDLNVFFTDDTNQQTSLKLSGKLTSNTGGFLLGVQKSLGQHVVLDINIFGPHYGAGKGEFIGVSSKPLSQNEQNALRDELNNIDIPLTDKTVNVNANGASLKLDGPWGGIRGAICLGVRF